MFLLRPFFGILKGGVLGAAGGAGAWALYHGAVAPRLIEYLLYGAVGALAGVFAGQPPWRKGAWVATILKAVFGLGAGIGLYVLARRFFHPTVDLFEMSAALPRHYLVMAPVVGAVWGMIVEIDDGGPSRSERPEHSG